MQGARHPNRDKRATPPRSLNKWFAVRHPVGDKLTPQVTARARGLDLGN